MASYPRDRGDGRWELRAYVGLVEGRQRFLYGTYQGGVRGARDAQADLVRRARAERGVATPKARRPARPSERTFAEAAEAWFEWKLPQMEPNGRDNARTQLDFYLLPHIGDIQLWRFRGEVALEDDDVPDPLLFDLTQFFADLVERGGRHGGPLSPASVVQGPARIASAVFAYTVRRGWLESNPTSSARRPHVPRRPPTVPTLDLLFRFFAFLIEWDPELYTWCELMNSGARRVDMAIRWNEWDPDTAEIIFGARGAIVARTEVGPTGKKVGLVRETPTSKRRYRKVALEPSANAALKAHRARMLEYALAAGLGNLPPDGFIFAEDPAGRICRRADWTTHAFLEAKRAAARAGITGMECVRLYDVRHLMITELYAAGIEAAVLAERAGNSVGTIERYYRHAAPAKDREAADVMAELRAQALAGKPAVARRRRA